MTTTRKPKRNPGRSPRSGMSLTHVLYVRCDADMISRLAAILDHHAHAEHVRLSQSDLVRKLLIEGMISYEAEFRV